MFQIKADLELIKIRPGFQSAVEGGARRIFLEAIRAWLRAMIAAIPAWEGTALGGLRPIGRFVKVAVPISPRGPGRQTHKIYGTTYQLGPAAGEQYTDYNIQMQFPNFMFEFYESLPYVIWNNFGQPLPEVKSAPWFAFQKAEAAFQNKINELLPEEMKRLALMIQKK